MFRLSGLTQAWFRSRWSSRWGGDPRGGGCGYQDGGGDPRGGGYQDGGGGCGPRDGGCPRGGGCVYLSGQ